MLISALRQEIVLTLQKLMIMVGSNMRLLFNKKRFRACLVLISGFKLSETSQVNSIGEIVYLPVVYL